MLLLLQSAKSSQVPSSCLFLDQCAVDEGGAGAVPVPYAEDGKDSMLAFKVVSSSAFVKVTTNHSCFGFYRNMCFLDKGAERTGLKTAFLLVSYLKNREEKFFWSPGKEGAESACRILRCPDFSYSLHGVQKCSTPLIISDMLLHMQDAPRALLQGWIGVQAEDSLVPVFCREWAQIPKKPVKYVCHSYLG